MVSASSSAGTSKMSAKAAHTTEASVPGAMPTPTLNGNATTNSITVTLKPPKEDGGAQVLGCIVEVAGGACATKNYGEVAKLPFRQVYAGPILTEYCVTGLEGGCRSGNVASS